MVWVLEEVIPAGETADGRSAASVKKSVAAAVKKSIAAVVKRNVAAVVKRNVAAAVRKNAVIMTAAVAGSVKIPVTVPV